MAEARPGESPYPDLDAGVVLRHVVALSGQGIVSGYPDGTFDPSGSVTLGEALKLVLLAAGLRSRLPRGALEQRLCRPGPTEGLLTAGSWPSWTGQSAA